MINLLTEKYVFKVQSVKRGGPITWPLNVTFKAKFSRKHSILICSGYCESWSDDAQVPFPHLRVIKDFADVLESCQAQATREAIEIADLYRDTVTRWVAAHNPQAPAEPDPNAG